MASNSSSEYKVVTDRIVSPDEDIIVTIAGGVYKGSIEEPNRYVTVSDLTGGPGGVGPTGPTGPEGASAYEVAVANGFVGTEQEWLDSLGGGGTANIADFVFTDDTENAQSVISLPGDKSMRIEAGVDSDLYLTAGDDVFIQTLGTGDDIHINAADDIRFSAGEETESPSSWRMDSEGLFQLPGDGYISNPIDSSGDPSTPFNDTIHLVPDSSLGTDQYLIIDPTTPNHIHIRAGGNIDSSTADLILGGEKTNVVVSDGSRDVYIRTRPDQIANSYVNANGSNDVTFLAPTTADIQIGYTVNVDGTDYVVDSIQPFDEGSNAVTAGGAVFTAGQSYTFTFNPEWSNSWEFGSNGVLYGPAEGTLVVSGLASQDNYGLSIVADNNLIITSNTGDINLYMDGAAYIGPSVAENRIAQIKDLEDYTSPTMTQFSPVFQATGLTFTGVNDTYPTYNSYYLRFGQLVTFNIVIDMSTVTNFGTGQFKVDLPFVPIATAANHFSAWGWVNPALPADELNGHVQMVADHIPNSQVLDLHWLKETTASPKPVIESILSQGNPVTFTTASKIYINGTYIAAV